jgi:hypothetical protein
MSSTTWTTILGIVQAVGVSLVDFFAHTNMEGGAFQQPTFWIGLIIAAAMGVKGYFTQGTPEAGKEMATKPETPPSV